MEWAGLAMLAVVALGMVGTGLPAFIVLIATSLGFGAWGVWAGAIPAGLLTAMPYRLVGLLESDLLQALPLYVLMGVLLNRLPLADRLFLAARALFGNRAAGPGLAGLVLGALLGPMNGSVGASVATLMRSVFPRLRAADASEAEALALVTTASTIGVIVPPSLVLILFGDAMMRAHTEALNTTRRMARIINTQDVFHGALVPAGLFLLGCAAVVWWRGRGVAVAARPGTLDWAMGGLTFVFVGGLLAAVAGGWLYAVEAAACGAFCLFAFGAASGALRGGVLDDLLRETMVVTGALFALFVGATTFSLVFRGFGSDRLLAEAIAGMPGGVAGAVAAVLLVLALAALVLDAFEIILVIVPVIMPPLLMRAPDAVWVSVVALLALQASFLVPPVGYAIMMARTQAAGLMPLRALVPALAPFLAVQALVLGLVLAFPGLVHVVADIPILPPQRPASEAAGMLNTMVPAPEE